MSSRVAKNPVTIPSGVDVKIQGSLLTVKGKNGELKHTIHSAVSVSEKEGAVHVAALKKTNEANALSGTTRALINNMVHGVSVGFERALKLVGVGYRAKASGKTLNLGVGFSHPVDLVMPEGVTVETPSQVDIILKGADKQKVAQVAANIRAIRPPEPYKGKGIRYVNERIILKEVKKK